MITFLHLTTLLVLSKQRNQIPVYKDQLRFIIWIKINVFVFFQQFFIRIIELITN